MDSEDGQSQGVSEGTWQVRGPLEGREGYGVEGRRVAKARQEVGARSGRVRTLIKGTAGGPTLELEAF